MISFHNPPEDRAAVMGYMDQRDCPTRVSTYIQRGIALLPFQIFVGAGPYNLIENSYHSSSNSWASLDSAHNHPVPGPHSPGDGVLIPELRRSERTASCRVFHSATRRRASKAVNILHVLCSPFRNHTFGCNKQHLNNTSVCHLNSFTNSLRLIPRYPSLSSSCTSSRSLSSRRDSWKRRKISVSVNSRWANHAVVTTLKRSRSMPNCCGELAITTTAFWTVERVTSAGRARSCEASICRVQEMPKRDVAGVEPRAGRRRVK